MPVAVFQPEFGQKVGQKARRMAVSRGGVVVCAVAVCCSATTALTRPRSARSVEEPVDFITPLARTGQPSPACRGPQCERVPPAGATTDQSGVPSIAPAVLVVALGAFAAHKGRSGRRVGTSRPQLRAIGSVETKKFLGDWASLAPSSGTEDASLPRQTVKVDLGNGLSQVRGIYDSGTDRYGEEYELNVGSTDNAYLISPSGGNPSVLVGVHDDTYATDFLEAIGDDLGRLGVVVLQFFDGKQAGTVQALIDARSESQEPLKICCTNLIAIALRKKLPPEDLDRCTIEVIKNRGTLEVEEGRTMRFVLTSTPKTPEGCVAFDPTTGTLFSGKFFSAHKAVTDECSGYDDPGNQGWEKFSSEWFHLFDCYFFTQNAQTAIRRLFMLAEALHGPDVEMLAPLHGPVVREQCWKLMAKYEAWTEQKLRMEDRRDTEVLVMYASAYGHTKTLANAIAAGLKTASVNVNLLNLEHCTSKDVMTAIKSCNGFFVGSPTLGGEMPTQVKEALGVVLSAASSEDTDRVPCGVFGSYGWSGEAVDELHFRLKDGGFPSVCDPIRVRFRPTPEALGLCKEAGVRMSQKLQKGLRDKKRRRIREIDAEVDLGSAAEAFGKMRSSMCAITTKNGEGEDIVSPISWVNQASFDPPGITIAVPKSGLDPFLSMSVDDQLQVLFKRYDVDGGGTLDTDEVRLLLQELFGANDPERAKLVEGKVEEAMKILDENNDGSVDIDEIREASTSGPLAEALKNQQKLLALQDSIGSAPQGIERDASASVPFNLNIMPTGTPEEALSTIEKHPKAKPSNGCVVLKDSNAFIECAVTQALDAGDHTILYAQVKGGKVMKDNDLTNLVSVIGSSQTAPTPSVAMAAAGGARGRSSFGGVSGTSALPTSSRSSFAVGSDSFTLASARSQARLSARAHAATTMAAQQQELSGFQTWTGLTPGKEYRLQTMTVDNVAADTTTIRSLDWDRDRFDIEFALERGTTYNSYVIRGAEKVAIVDTSHEKFDSLFFEALDKQVDYATVGYLIVSHTEPDHSGLIGKVVEKALAAGNEDFTVVGSKVCIQFLENLIHSPFKSKVVGNGDKLDLGGGHELEFAIAPNLHWPDTMFTYDHGTRLLYTCDAFGMHYCSDKLVDEEGVKELVPHYELYYDCLMKPNARSVINALKKTKHMDFHTIATGHGPMLTENTLEWVENYRSWSEKAMENAGPTVAIFWVSNYGESERLSQVFAHGLTASDITVEMHDLNAIDAFELTECLVQASVLVVMCPPQGQNTAQSAIGSIVAGAKEKKHRFMILESAAPDQEPVELLTQRFVQQNIPQALPAIKLEEKWSPVNLQTFEEAGMSIGKLLSQKAKASKAKSLNKDMERALGRLASSLYVVTAKKAGIEHAMVASWVTPASQSPLGVSLSIAKDRAMEPLLRVGDTFTINFLEEGKSLGLMKHFLQKFAPGQNRLAGVDWFPGSNGAAVLRDACAYLECRIISRMDATDHWIAYAEVSGGSVAKKEAETAVHHRKVGTYY